MPPRFFQRRVISGVQTAILLGGLLCLTNLFIAICQVVEAWPLQAIAFAGVMLVPGIALLRLLRIKAQSVMETMFYSIGMSILVLIVSGLAVNQLLHLLSVARPLELAPIWIGWNLFVLGIIIAGRFRNTTLLTLQPPAAVPAQRNVWLVAGAAVIVPLLAAAGASRLNNGDDAIVACTTLVYGALLMAYILIRRNKLPDSALVWCIFMVALAVLLMTSLRSWDIAGHDLAREFRVYTLTHVNGWWNIGAYRDPYNACLSITILPEMLAKLLHVSGLTVFKLLLQIIFALCPAIIFLMLRQHVSKLGAIVGCMLFISYPTFINDSAMLTRQGVAYVFFSLALLAVMDRRHIQAHRWLFLLCGVGVVLSHYSTSYMFVAIFGVALICKLVIQRIRGWRLHLKGDNFTVLTPAILVTLVAMTFLWYSQFTATSGGLSATIASSAKNIPHLLSDDNKSSDTSAALLMSSHTTQADIYEAYLTQPVIQPNGTTTAPSAAISARYEPQLTADDLGVTRLGNQLHHIGAKPTFTNDLRQQFAKVLQLLAAASVVYAAYAAMFYANYMLVRKKSRKIVLPLDLIALCIAGIILLILMVVLPNISLNYGVLRTFQQSLIFLLIPLMVALTVLGRRLRPQLRTAIATSGMTLLFLLFTGFFAQIFGGVGAALSLNNHGLYYGLYYSTRADLRAYSWMKHSLPPQSDVRAASFARAIMHDPSYPYKTLGIMPSQVTADSYVYLDQAQVVTHKFYVYQNGSPLIMTFPLNYYDEQRDQIYSTTMTAVYH